MAKSAAQPATESLDDPNAFDSAALSAGKGEDAQAPAAQSISQVDLDAAMSGVIGKLQALADKQVQLKSAIEQRWLDDTRQYQGRYPVATEQALKLSEKSKLFVNLTRANSNSWEARLSDLLFPTDDKNWGIKPTPAPHLPDAVMAAVNKAVSLAAQATAAHQGGNQAGGAALAAQGTAAAQQAASIQDAIDEAQKRCDLMESEIDSQLKESHYNIRSREAIRDFIRLGTGIMKGPITGQKMRRSWIPASQAQQAAPAPADPMAGMALPVAANAPGALTDASQPASAAAPTDLRSWKTPLDTSTPTPPANVAPTSPGTGYVLDQQPDPAPEFVRVDPWSFFPDMSARTPDETEFNFERHLWNAKQVRKAVKTMGLDPVACAELLRTKATAALPTYWAQLREITANSTIIGMESRYQVWEFNGVLEDEDLEAIASATGNTSVMDYVNDNPLLEVPVIIWFCQGHLLKFAPYPLDSGESLYSVINFEPDDTSMFGFGVPWLQADSQSAINGAWRMMMDNGGLSVGPQIILDSDAIKPADGTWTIRPMKVWLKTSTSLTKAPDSYKPFETFNITANQTQLQAIINLAQEFTNTETSMPLIASGGMDTHITKTTGGMSMLMNSANVVFRRVVKSIDDKLSTPNIRRMYDWNMQFNKRDDIKGDFAVVAQGSSVLLVKEMQAQTLMTTLTNFSNHPVIGPMLKTPQVLRNLFKAQMIPPDDVVKSDDQIEQEAVARAAAAPAAAAPANANDPQVLQMKLASAEKIAADRTQAMLQVADKAQQTALITLAQTHNMSLDELQTQLQINQNDINHRERIFAAELASSSSKPPPDFAGPGIDT